MLGEVNLHETLRSDKGKKQVLDVLNFVSNQILRYLNLLLVCTPYAPVPIFTIG